MKPGPNRGGDDRGEIYEISVARPDASARNRRAWRGNCRIARVRLPARLVLLGYCQPRRARGAGPRIPAIYRQQARLRARGISGTRSLAGKHRYSAAQCTRALDSSRARGRAAARTLSWCVLRCTSFLRPILTEYAVCFDDGAAGEVLARCSIDVVHVSWLEVLRACFFTRATDIYYMNEENTTIDSEAKECSLAIIHSREYEGYMCSFASCARAQLVHPYIGNQSGCSSRSELVYQCEYMDLQIA